MVRVPHRWGRTRRGLSILEVMISIGVATIGLLGALSLLPLASTLAQIGLNEDSKSATGRAAVDTFDVAGMRRPDMMLWWNSGSFDSPAALWDPGADGVWGSAGDDDGDGTNNETDEAGWQGSDDFRIPVCIDPRLISRNSPPTAVTSFPFVASANITMRRITLRSVSRNDPAPPTGISMSAAQADQVFQTTDDIEVTQPEDTTEFAIQEFTVDASGDPMKRQFYGKSSWMAILNPIPGSDTDLYNLSIVVLHERDLDIAAAPPVERVCDIAFADFYSGGVTGGDMRLTATTADLTERETRADIDIRKNNWLLLAQDRTTQGRGKVFHWYRVLESDIEDADPTTDQREVTLIGPDWVPDAGIPTQAIFMPGVVAVYERVVRLEKTNLWPLSNN